MRDNIYQKEKSTTTNDNGLNFGTKEIKYFEKISKLSLLSPEQNSS